MKRITCTLLCCSMLISAVMCGCSAGNTSKAEESSQTSVKPYEEPLTETTVATTGNKIHINDNTLGDIWITELEGVKKNTLNNDNFTSDSTFVYYSEDGKPASTEGIDISSYSGEIDWGKVKNAGVDFVMVRLGGRGFGDEGTLYSDDKALSYIQGAKDAGLKTGAYFFSQATTTEEAVAEARYCKELLGDTSLDYPLAYDWEIMKNEEARTDKVSSTQATECARAFCETVKSLGYKPMVYSAGRELYFKYDLTRLSDYDIWYVDYSTGVPDFYYQFTMWQYSENGKVDGIEGAVDLNICFTNIAGY